MAGDMLVLARLLCWLALEDFGAEMDVRHHDVDYFTRL